MSKGRLSYSNGICLGLLDSPEFKGLDDYWLKIKDYRMEMDRIELEAKIREYESIEISYKGRK